MRCNKRSQAVDPPGFLHAEIRSPVAVTLGVPGGGLGGADEKPLRGTSWCHPKIHRGFVTPVKNKHVCCLLVSSAKI